MNIASKIALLCLLSVTLAAEDQWHWTKAQTNIDHGWDVYKGDCDIVIKDGSFSAKLFWWGSNSSKDIQISLKGSIVNGRLTVRETINNADSGSGWTYTGTLTTRKFAEKWRDGITGEQTIMLSSAAGFIGLTRTVKK